MCEFCDKKSASAIADAENSILCDCGHLEIDHVYLTLREIDAFRDNDIECGRCTCVGGAQTSDGEALTCMWVEFKPGQNCDTVEAILDRLEITPEDPCDKDFMKDISS